MTDYLKRQLEAEKRLAELLGLKDIKIERRFDDPYLTHHNGYGEVPRWCREWSACGPLMVGHDFYPQEDNPTRDGISVDSYGVYEYFKDHPTKDDAVRFAIVQAVIAKLSNKEEVSK